MVDAAASYLQTVVVHPIQTGLSQSVKVHGAQEQDTTENCIQHTTKQQTLDRRGEKDHNIRTMAKNKNKETASEKEEENNTSSVASPGPEM
jgi:hypothetical protein